MLEELRTWIVNAKPTAVKSRRQPAGTNLLFTGTLPTLKRSDAEAMAEAQGAKILSGVSAKLNYLVVGEDAGSKLERQRN